MLKKKKKKKLYIYTYTICRHMYILVDDGMRVLFTYMNRYKKHLANYVCIKKPPSVGILLCTKSIQRKWPICLDY